MTPSHITISLAPMPAFDEIMKKAFSLTVHNVLAFMAKGILAVSNIVSRYLINTIILYIARIFFLTLIANNSFSICRIKLKLKTAGRV